MTPQELASTLRAIEQTIKRQYSIPIGTRASELNEFQKVTKISIYYENDQLVFLTRIPLVIDTELTLYYNILPVPMIHNQDNKHAWYISVLIHTYIAITKDRKRFTTYTEKQLSECKETAIYRICRSPQPLQENNDTPCEVQLFMGPEVIPTGCVVEKSTLRGNIYHKLLGKNTWIHIGNDTLTISCTDLTEPFTKEIKGSGEITIVNKNCQVFTRDAVLTATDELLNINYKDFISKTNMRMLLNKVSQSVHNYKIEEEWNDKTNIQVTDLHGVSKSLDKVQQMIYVEVLREQNLKHQFIHSNLLYATVGLAIISIILILVLYIMIKCQYISNRQVRDIPSKLVKYRRNDYVRAFEETPFTPPPSPR